MNYRIKVDIPNIEKFYNLVRWNTRYEVDIVKGRYIIDAKSLLGLFSVDMAHGDVYVRTHTDDEKANEDFRQLIKEFIINE